MISPIATLRAQSVVLYQQHRFAEAERTCRNILALDAQCFDTLIMLGALAMQRGQVNSAADWFRIAIRVNDGSAHAHNNLGIALTQLGSFLEAVSSFDRAIALWPGFAEAYCNRGTALEHLGRVDEALLSLDAAIRCDPHLVRAYSNRGSVLQRLRRLDEALQAYDLAIRIAPDYVPAHSKRATVLLELRRYGEAIESCDRALTLDPQSAVALINKAAVLRQLARFDESLMACERAAALRPDDPVIQNGLGGALNDLGRCEAALQVFRRASSLDPGYAEAHWNTSLCLLRMGQFQEGWRLFEWRKSLPVPLGARALPQPVWTGVQPLQGRSLFVYAEQGLGDTVQFARYVPPVAALGARVVFAVQRPLLALLHDLDHSVRVVPDDEAPPATDYHCSLMSLPLALGSDLSSIPSPGGYLTSDPGKLGQWRARIGYSSLPRIGLAWSGNPRHANDANRSIPLADLLRHLPRGFQYFNLQKDLRESDQPALRANPLLADFSADVDDFADTAALCECMDLVISVDTSVAHVAGALGRKTWILLPVNSDWRWMMGTDTVWYRSVQLYRQETPGSWHQALQRVASALRADTAMQPLPNPNHRSVRAQT